TAAGRPHAPQHVVQDGVDQGAREGGRERPVARQPPHAGNGARGGWRRRREAEGGSRRQEADCGGAFGGGSVITRRGNMPSYVRDAANGTLTCRFVRVVRDKPTGSAARTPRAADREGRPIASRSGRRTSGLIERLLGARDLGDETSDQSLDLGRWQVVAGIAVRQAHIAANHEGAQARL